jgi:hypothetical protein
MFIRPFTHPASMASSGMDAPGQDLRVLGGDGFGTFLYGQDRHAIHRVAFALAQLNDPNPYWIDIQDPRHGDDPDSPVGLGWIPDDHLFSVVESETPPLDAEANMALWTIIRSDEPRSMIAQFTDFLRLPRIVQHAISGSRSEQGRPVFVIANADRARSYYPTTASDVRPFIDSMVHAGIMPIFAAEGRPGAGRWAFDFVFEIRTPSPADWRHGTMVCERAPTGLPVISGQVRPLATLPGVDR